MDNIEQTRMVMLRFALKLYELALINDYVINTNTEECFNMLWDCQCCLMEFNETILLGRQEKERLRNDFSLRQHYSHQLLTIIKMGVLTNHSDCSHVNDSELSKIIII